MSNVYHVFYAFPSADYRIAAAGRHIGSGVDIDTLQAVSVWRHEVQQEHLLDFRRQVDACADVLYVDRVSGDEEQDYPTYTRWQLHHAGYRLPRSVAVMRGTGGQRWANSAHAVTYFPQWPGLGWAPGFDQGRIRGGQIRAYHPGTQWGRWANDLMAVYAGWDEERRIKLPLVEEELDEHPGAELIAWEWADNEKRAFYATLELKPGLHVKALVKNRPLQRRVPLMWRDPLGIIEADMHAYLEREMQEDD